jgi:hypothetical protein
MMMERSMESWKSLGPCNLSLIRAPISMTVKLKSKLRAIEETTKLRRKGSKQRGRA